MGKFTGTTVTPGVAPDEKQSQLIDRLQRDAQAELPTGLEADRQAALEQGDDQGVAYYDHQIRMEQDPQFKLEDANKRIAEAESWLANPDLNPDVRPNYETNLAAWQNQKAEAEQALAHKAGANPVIQGLLSEGLLEEGDINAAAVSEQDFLQEEQRERERIEPLSQRSTGFAEYNEESSDPFHAQLGRANVVHQAFQHSAESPSVVGTYIDKPSAEALSQGQDPYADKQGVAATLSRFGAAELDLANNHVAVSPEFTTVGTMVVEKWLSTQDGNIGGSDVDFGQPIESDEDLALEELVDADPDFGKTRAQGNERIGRTILQEFLRERANAEGLPSDTYTTDPNMKISKEDSEFVGGMMKEAYAAALGDDYITVNNTPGAQTVYSPTATGLRRMQKADEAAGFPFDNREVPPLLTPPQDKAGQPEFEARTYTRGTSRNIGGQTSQDLKVINEARKNFSQIAWKIDSTGEGVLYSMGKPAISQAIAMYTALNSVAGDDVIGLREMVSSPDAQAQRQQYAFADLMGVGPKKLDSLLGEYTRLETNLDLKRKQWQEETDAFEREKLEKEGTALAQRLQQYNPLQIYRLEVNKFIESMNTIAKYQGRANYLTLSVQMLTGRMNIQQNKLNPQNNKLVRYALRDAKDFDTISPHDNNIATRMFKEHGAVLFLPKPQGKYAFPEDRITSFNQELETSGSRLNKIAALGAELLNTVGDPSGDRDLFRQVAPKDTDAQRVINMPPALQNSPAPQFSPELMQELTQHSAEEVPYIMEYMMNLAKFKQGKPFNTTMEAEMDGITNGPSSNGYALGIENTMYRAGVLFDGDKKLMRSGDTTPLDLRDQMANTMKAQVSGEGNLTEAMADIAYAAIADKPNYLKKPPMTTIYGQELKNLKQHAEAAMFTGEKAGDIQAILKDSGEDAGKAANYLHGLIVDSLTDTLNPIALQTSRQLRANNVLAVLSGEPLYYQNPMGFRGYAAGKAHTGEVTKSHLKVGGKDKPVTHYEEKPHGAAARGSRTGGWGHGQIIPAVTQSYDATMIAKSFSGRNWERLKQNSEARGKTPGFLPIFDAGKAGYGKLDLVRNTMNRAWEEGIEGHSFVDSIMGPDGWYNTTVDKVAQDIRSTTGEVEFIDSRGNPIGKYRGLGEILMAKGRKKRLQGIVETTYPFEDPKILTNPEALEKASERIAEAIDKELTKIGADKARKTGSLPPQQVEKAIGVILNGLNVRSVNGKMTRDTAERRKKAFAKKKQQARKGLQVDLG